ncbi:hypothetical protein E4T47_04772 [Aureobasidium subglaciale]|nr:hypothetical protein E4T47_04772 [Aureobasidium subglaciale]
MSNFSWHPPTVPFKAQTRDGSPFTVWHVCMICQQPRSARYHSEHPIYDYNTHTPSQTICRRCAAKAPPISTPATLVAPEPVTSAPIMRHIPFRHIKLMPSSQTRCTMVERAANTYDPKQHSSSPTYDHSSTYEKNKKNKNSVCSISPASPEVDFPPPQRGASAPLINLRPAPPRRVSFSQENEIVTLPQELPSERVSMQGLSHMRIQPPNLSGIRNAAVDHEHDKHSKNIYIDPPERSYASEPKWTPLSESPARELPLADNSYAHGPYRAEVSPSPSMRVHVDNYDFLPLDKSGNDLEYKSIKATNPTDPAVQKPGHVYQGKQQKREKKVEDRGWTKFTTVREYIDDQGPYMEVEEKVVFDD